MLVLVGTIRICDRRNNMRALNVTRMRHTMTPAGAHKICTFVGTCNCPLPIFTFAPGRAVFHVF